MSANSGYATFLESKRKNKGASGFAPNYTPDFLYPFQAYITDWCAERGASAVFADCGLGKTPMQLAWAENCVRHLDKPVLIVAPLAVAEQTHREGDKFGINVTVCREQSDMRAGVNITNYEMIHHFTPDGLSGLVLDESSILKNFGGKYRQWLSAFAYDVPYKLCCTATPAPNDLIEIINHSDFLRVLNGKEAIALYFIQDGNTTHKWRLKGHAETDFWRWMATWCVALRKPSDLGYDDNGFILPPLSIEQHTCDGHIIDGLLFPVEAHTMDERRQARKESINERVGVCADLVNNSDEPWVVWCNLNNESEALKRSIPDAVEVKGSDSHEHKIDAITGFSSGKYRVLVTKPTICGFGMNWQHCARIAFVGLSDSWEQYYQAVRRCWRFGQTREVIAHMVVAETEGAVVENIRRKERNADAMMANIVAHMGGDVTDRVNMEYHNLNGEQEVPAWLTSNK